MKLTFMNLNLDNKTNDPEEPDEEDIKKILAKTGKYTEQDELNCGACGYNTCREKARAVYYGWAELEMCLPYMRQRAESLANKFLESVPNGVVVIDSTFTIQEVNPTILEMFNREGVNLIGKTLDELLTDISHFAEVMETQIQKEGKIKHGDRVFEELIFPIEDEDLIVGIFSDITEMEKQRKDLKDLKQETLLNARKVIDKQMRVAQEIAGLLGETTAETKVTLSRLIDIISGEEEKNDG